MLCIQCFLIIMSAISSMDHCKALPGSCLCLFGQHRPAPPPTRVLRRLRLRMATPHHQCPILTTCPTPLFPSLIILGLPTSVYTAT